MTFTEAALEVLKGAGEPLHYKKITELAIAGNLLSHVGKTPEVTMSSRLATLVKKDRGLSPIIKVRPGVFALRESDMQTDTDTSTETPTNDISAAEAKPESEQPVERPRLPGADVFPEEADDDAPILAGLEDESAEERGGRRRRRRRRRGGKGGGLEGMPTEPLAERPPQASRPVERESPPPPRRDRDNSRFDRDASRRDREAPRSDNNDRNNDRRPEFDRDRRPERAERPREAQQTDLDWNRQPAEGDLLGKDLADAAYHVLTRGDRTPASFARVADMLVRRGRLSGAPEALAPTVAAALRADAARNERAHGRPRFRISGGRVSLSEWLLSREAVTSEERVEQAAEGQRDHVRRAFVNRLNDLPAAGFAELVATWLNGEGVTALRAVRRPGSSGREFHFAGTLRRGAEENRLALLVLRAGRDLDRETVVEMRGSMHHYGGATGAWLISTGRVNPAAREEAAAEGAAPCALFGGSDLARSMEKLGIGLRQHFVALCDIDFDLLEALGDNTEPRRDGRDSREGRDHERQPERRPRDVEGRAPDAGAGREREREQDLGNEPARPFDLLDPEAAEASRLVPGAANWSPDEAQDEPQDEPTDERLTMRFTPSSENENDGEDDAADDTNGVELDELDDNAGENTENAEEHADDES